MEKSLHFIGEMRIAPYGVYFDDKDADALFRLLAGASDGETKDMFVDIAITMTAHDNLLEVDGIKIERKDGGK